MEDVKEYISTSSLKRIFGKVQYSSDPSISTLNILAKYINFKDWYDLVNQLNMLEKPVEEVLEIHTVQHDSPQTASGSKRFKWKIIVAIAAVIGVSTGIVLFLTSPKAPVYSITYKTTKNTSPSNIVFEYDLSQVKSNEIYIDFNDHFARDNKKKLDKGKNMITHTYMVASVYHPLLIIDKKVVDTLTVQVYSDGWEFIIAKYFPNSKEFFPVSATSVSRKDGILTIPSEQVYKYIEDTVRNYWIKYRYIKDFKTPADNITFKVKGRSRSTVQNYCNEIDVWVIGTKNNIVFKVFDPGCGGEYSKVQLGNKILDGNYNDLSAFGHDLSEWQEIVLKVKDKKATISIGNTTIYEGVVEGEVGTLSGFVIHSKGTAEFDYVDLEANDKVLFRDDF